MRWNIVLRYIGLILLLDAVFMLLAACVSLLDGMDTGFYPLLQSFLLTSILGSFPLIFVSRGGAIVSQEGYAVVTGAWLMSCLAGMLPYVLWGGEFSVRRCVVRERFGVQYHRRDDSQRCGSLAQGDAFLACLDPLAGRYGRSDVRARGAAVDGFDENASFERRAFRRWPRTISDTGPRKSCRFCWSSMSD